MFAFFPDIYIYIYISKSTSVEEERPATHNEPFGDGKYKIGGGLAMKIILRFYKSPNR